METVGAIFVCELCNDGNRLIGFHFGRDFGGIHHNLCVEDFLLDTLVEVVGDGSNEHALCEVGDFGSRNEAIELCGDRSGPVVAVDGHRLTLLEVFSETFGDGLGSFTYDLTAKDISHCILDNLTLLISVITRELREVLKAQTNCYFVRAYRGNEVVR